MQIRLMMFLRLLFFIRPTESADDGAYIYGLYLEAAHWNGAYIEEQIIHQPIESFPMVHMKVKQLYSSKKFRILNEKKLKFSADGSQTIRCWHASEVSHLLHIEKMPFEP